MVVLKESRAEASVVVSRGQIIIITFFYLDLDPDA